MARTQRRRAARRPVDWAARYRLSKTAAWRPCRLIDISETGTAIEPLDLTAGEEPVGWLDLELVSPEEELLRFHGEIRHMTRSAQGRVRLGIEFAGLSTLEESLMGLLSRLDELV
jgi:PilZ domain